MTYLEEVKTQINNRNFAKFMQLWEEYCTSDQVDTKEFIEILKAVKASDFAKSFSKLVETALPLWQSIQNKQDAYEVLKLIIDLQTTNSSILAEIAYQSLHHKYANDPHFNERIRLVGLRPRDNFQGALANYDLLAHMAPGKFVFHNGGWGAGELIDISTIRQQVSIEFENVTGRKHLTFENAFKVLVPLSDEHFLVRRFAHADALEKEAREHPVEVIKLLLRDLGPKSAGEIKDALCELVIPENDWAKWWQTTRTKLKKDPLIDSPATLRDAFSLRHTEVTPEELLHQAIQHKSNVDELIQTTYTFLRDLPQVKKNQEIRNSIKEKLLQQLTQPDLSVEQELQLCICLESQFGHEVSGKEIKKLIQNLANIETVLNSIDIIAFKKRALVLIRENRSDWQAIFLNLFLSIKHSAIRDYLLKELNQKESRPQLEKTLHSLLNKPDAHPECVVWYTQKLISGDDETIPYSDVEGIQRWMETYLILLHQIEGKSQYRDLAKKMYGFLSGKRYAVVRSIMEGASLDFVKEFLLLASKCHTFSDHDRKILGSLAAVVQPSLEKRPSASHKMADGNIIWTTEESYRKAQEQVRHIGTVEIVENAREIEAARALGDLRENSEYKFALEKRSRLQGQLKTLSEQINRARIITKEDIHPSEVGVGTVVKIADSQGEKAEYAILGPWDADPERHILSFQSKLAQSMLGCKKGDNFQFRDETYTVLELKSYL